MKIPKTKPPANRHSHDETTEGNTKTEKEPMRRLSIDISETLHMRFKVACAKTRRKMTPEIVALIEVRTRELEDESS